MHVFTYLLFSYVCPLDTHTQTTTPQTQTAIDIMEIERRDNKKRGKKNKKKNIMREESAYGTIYAI